MPPSRSIRVMCVDDHVVVLRGLASILSDEPDIDLIACSTSAEEALECYPRLRPDVLLMDLQLPGMSGFEAIRAIREKEPRARIIVLTMYSGTGDIRRALEAGASGYLFKNSLADNLAQTIRSVYDGNSTLTTTTPCILDNDAALTPREVKIMQMIADGLRNKEIGHALGISDETVHAHLRRVFAKLNVHDRTHALTAAVRLGYVRI